MLKCIETRVIWHQRNGVGNNSMRRPAFNIRGQRDCYSTRLLVYRRMRVAEKTSMFVFLQSMHCMSVSQGVTLE